MALPLSLAFDDPRAETQFQKYAATRHLVMDFGRLLLQVVGVSTWTDFTSSHTSVEPAYSQATSVLLTTSLAALLVVMVRDRELWYKYRSLALSVMRISRHIFLLWNIWSICRTPISFPLSTAVMLLMAPVTNALVNTLLHHTSFDHQVRIAVFEAVTAVAIVEPALKSGAFDVLDTYLPHHFAWINKTFSALWMFGLRLAPLQRHQPLAAFKASEVTVQFVLAASLLLLCPLIAYCFDCHMRVQFISDQVVPNNGSFQKASLHSSLALRALLMCGVCASFVPMLWDCLLLTGELPLMAVRDPSTWSLVACTVMVEGFVRVWVLVGVSSLPGVVAPATQWINQRLRKAEVGRWLDTGRKRASPTRCDMAQQKCDQGMQSKPLSDPWYNRDELRFSHDEVVGSGYGMSSVPDDYPGLIYQSDIRESGTPHARFSFGDLGSFQEFVARGSMTSRSIVSGRSISSSGRPSASSMDATADDMKPGLTYLRQSSAALHGARYVPGSLSRLRTSDEGSLGTRSGSSTGTSHSGLVESGLCWRPCLSPQDGCWRGLEGPSHGSAGVPECGVCGADSSYSSTCTSDDDMGVGSKAANADATRISDLFGADFSVRMAGSQCLSDGLHSSCSSSNSSLSVPEPDMWLKKRSAPVGNVGWGANISWGDVGGEGNKMMLKTERLDVLSMLRAQQQQW